MVGDLKHTRPLAVLTVLLLMFSLSACITYLPRGDGTDTEETQPVTETEASAEETESEKNTETSRETGIETDAKGFPNLPEDDLTKRY